jgi:hypothetical protein
MKRGQQEGFCFRIKKKQSCDELAEQDLSGTERLEMLKIFGTRLRYLRFHSTKPKHTSTASQFPRTLSALLNYLHTHTLSLSHSVRSLFSFFNTTQRPCPPAWGNPMMNTPQYNLRKSRIRRSLLSLPLYLPPRERRKDGEGESRGIDQNAAVWGGERCLD